MTFEDMSMINEAQRSFGCELSRRMKECVGEGPAVRSKKTNKSHANYCALFCERMGLKKDCPVKGFTDERG